jgi:hypothetical protein
MIKQQTNQAREACCKPSAGESECLGNREMQMSGVTARPTNHGTVMLAITDAAGRRAHVELPIELAEKLKAQIEAALVAARASYGMEAPLPESHTWMEVDELPGDERG